MAARIGRQPNGKLCAFSLVMNEFVITNMTEADYNKEYSEPLPTEEQLRKNYELSWHDFEVIHGDSDEFPKWRNDLLKDMNAKRGRKHNW